MSALAEAAGYAGWTLQTPRLARHSTCGWLTGYVSAVLDAHGEVDHYQWWVEAAGAVVVASDPDDQERLTALAAVTDAQTALTVLTRETTARRTP